MIQLLSQRGAYILVFLLSGGVEAVLISLIITCLTASDQVSGINWYVSIAKCLL